MHFESKVISLEQYETDRLNSLNAMEAGLKEIETIPALRQEFCATTFFFKPETKLNLSTYLEHNEVEKIAHDSSLSKPSYLKKWSDEVSIEKSLINPNEFGLDFSYNFNSNYPRALYESGNTIFFRTSEDRAKYVEEFKNVSTEIALKTEERSQELVLKLSDMCLNGLLTNDNDEPL